MEEWNKETALDEVEINEHDMQNEWNMQPVIYLENSLRVSELVHRRDSLQRDKIKTIKDVQKVSTGKVLSDAALGRELDTDQELIDLNFQISNAKASVSALQQKKASLENLQELLINGISAEPKSPDEKKAMREHIQKGVREKNGESKKGSG
ncbi:MAG: hypothetical protein HOG49_18305 [Candidatus Scalindua sp.]|jgi:GTP1/Obg family GTP-binding protein|nr:hypothetical protein [Candidatus Scalindua sp.]